MFLMRFQRYVSMLIDSVNILNASVNKYDNIHNNGCMNIELLTSYVHGIHLLAFVYS